jgi:hypothetical protein
MRWFFHAVSLDEEVRIGTPAVPKVAQVLHPGHNSGGAGDDLQGFAFQRTGELQHGTRRAQARERGQGQSGIIGLRRTVVGGAGSGIPEQADGITHQSLDVMTGLHVELN